MAYAEPAPGSIMELARINAVVPTAAVKSVMIAVN